MDGLCVHCFSLFLTFVSFLDTGFFSIQVLQKALEAFNIELIPYASQNQLAQEARVNPQSIQAYICNLREHWFTIRRFGQQYFDLNSVSIAPKLISNTYLSLYLAQLQQSGYSIFIVYGHLPPCTADERLKTSTIDPTYYQSLTVRVSDANRQNKEYSNESTSSFDENEIQRAIKASIELDNAQDKALQQVLAQSLREVQEQDDSNEHEDDTDELNQRLLDQAIAASLKSDIPVRNEVNTTTEAVPTSTTTTEPTREGKITFFRSRSY